MTTLKPVLYAEDNEDQAFFMELAFAKLGISNPLCIVPNGESAMAYLSPAAPHDKKELPCLCLLDLHMPGRWSGLDVLKWMKNEPSLAHLPVIVLTSSEYESDIHRAYLLGADGYVIKPPDQDGLMRLMGIIRDYWLVDKRPAEKFVDFASTAVALPVAPHPLNAG